ncbi:hypothetical protein CR513_52947, partial [Mucuna pruriens]
MVVFDYQEVLDIYKKVIIELGENPTNGQRATHRKSKKDCKALYLIHHTKDGNKQLVQALQAQEFKEKMVAEETKRVIEEVGKRNRKEVKKNKLLSMGQLLEKDDYKRKMWVYLIERKDEMLDVFIKFKVMVEKQCGKKVKILKIDGGGEYNLIEFQKCSG